MIVLTGEERNCKTGQSEHTIFSCFALGIEFYGLLQGLEISLN